MLIHVLTRLAADIGYDITDNRNTLLQLANQSAAIMHGMLECNSIYREVTLVVPTDSVVSLPSMVGELKGMREHTGDIPFMLHGISSPRYVKDALDYTFHNWRDLGTSPIHTSLAQVSVLELVTTVLEDVVVLVTGQTQVADHYEERVSLIANNTFTTQVFGPRIDSIASVSQSRSCDIIIKDLGGTELATLYNNADKTRYKIVDVSELCFSEDTEDGESLIDVCYKVPLTRLVRDSDSFFAGDEYDEAWYNMAMYCHYHPVADKAADAMRHNAAGINFLRVGKGTEKNIVRKLSFGRNKYYDLCDGPDRIPGACTHIDHSNE